MENLVRAALHRGRALLEAWESEKGYRRGSQRKAVCKVMLKGKRYIFACYRLRCRWSELLEIRFQKFRFH